MEYARRAEQRNESVAIARSGDQFGIVTGATVSRTVVVLTYDCVLVCATRCRWQFPGEPEGDCRARDFWDRRLARSARNSGKSRGSLRTRVRFRTGGAEFLGHLRFGRTRHALCSILDWTSAQVPRFLIFASKPCGQTRSVWQISLSKKVNAACENALTSHWSVTI
jgi:hypothetical protein